jgi:hypothetical protein
MNAINISVGKLEGKIPLADVILNERIILKWNFK